MTYEKKESKSVGGGWAKESKKGMKYVSLRIEDENYVMFKNTYKKNPGQPDYKIYKQEPLEKKEEDDLPF